MRIGIVTWSARKVGGTETYLDSVISALSEAGHRIALLSEVDSPADRSRISIPEGSPFFCISTDGSEHALDQLRQWRPDLIYMHALSESELEARAAAIAPVVFFAHDYYGTCVDGAKLFSFPVARPCERAFGWGCLVHFYPRRCGGLNPLTMARAYSDKTARLRILRGYRAILTASDHMRREYIRHGFAESVVHLVPPPVCLPADSGARSATPGCAQTSVGENNGGPRVSRSEDEWRLLFAGRMTRIKGGAALLDAAPMAAAALGRPIRLVFAGEGSARGEWESHARLLESRNRNVRTEFMGWLEGEALGMLAKETHLLVVPSVWPEPFGLVGPEFGLRGIPSAAFAVGGIPEWLTEGVNGCLAPGDPPTAHGLAAAITRCLHDSDEYARLRRGAVALAQRFSLARHLETLMAIFAEAAASGGGNA